MRVEYITEILKGEEIVRIEPVKKGCSGDEKYCVETRGGQRMLVRISDMEEFERKKAEQGMMEKLYNYCGLTSEPLGFGVCASGAVVHNGFLKDVGYKRVYALSEWMEGEDAEAAMVKMNDAERYELGIKVGEMLRRIHEMPAPNDAEVWSDRFWRKVRERIDFYNENKLGYDSGDVIVRHLQDKRHLMNGRPQTFNHGDVNVQNIMILTNGEVRIIDFNSYNNGYGDPWWELDAPIWGTEPSTDYYNGLLKGYFGGEVPQGFFEVYAYYFAYDALAAICETAQGNMGEAEDGKRHVSMVLGWFDRFRNYVPGWYRG